MLNKPSLGYEILRVSITVMGVLFIPVVAVILTFFILLFEAQKKVAPVIDIPQSDSMYEKQEIGKNITIFVTGDDIKVTGFNEPYKCRLLTITKANAVIVREETNGRR